MKIHGGLYFVNASVFVESDDFTKTEHGKAVNVDQTDYHPDYDPEDPISTGDNDSGYVLVSLSIGFRIVINLIIDQESL